MRSKNVIKETRWEIGRDDGALQDHYDFENVLKVWINPQERSSKQNDETAT